MFYFLFGLVVGLVVALVYKWQILNFWEQWSPGAIWRRVRGKPPEHKPAEDDIYGDAPAPQDDRE